MTVYKYKALKENNKIVDGEVEASSPREARELIRKLGFVPTKIYTEQELLEQKNEMIISDKNIFLKLREKIMFTSELEVILSSGIAILEALQSIETNSPNKKLKRISSVLKTSIMNGSTFAQALQMFYSKTFGPVYIALIKTGENSGELDITLGRMLVLLKKEEAIKDKIISASIYPSLLLLMLGGLLIIFAKFVFPKFAEFIIFNGTEIPHFAQMFMDTLNFVGTFWWLIILGIVAVIYVITLLFKVSEVKNCWDNFILKLPVISDFITYINLSNFMTVMYIAYEAGVPILTCLELANKTVGNNNIKTQIAKTSILVKTGKGLVESFGCTGAIPSALLSMLSAGEKSGTLGKMFKDCADVIDKRVDMALTTLSKLFEPTVMVILGISVLIIAIVFYQMYIGMLGTLF